MTLAAALATTALLALWLPAFVLYTLTRGTR